MQALDRKIWAIAWPAILSNISIPLLGLVDAAILGHLGSNQYLGAVALGSALLSFLYWGFSFLRMGTTGLVARAMGSGQPERAALILLQSGVLAVALALLVMLAHPLWLGFGFSLMAPQPELETLAQSYASIRIISAPAVLGTYAIVGWFIGRQNTRWPMLIVVTTNIINIALDFLFIMGLGMHSDGAALATVCAEYLGAGLAIWAAWRNLPRLADTFIYRRLLVLSDYGRLLRSNRHLFVRTTCLLFSFAFFTAMGDKLGADTLAANAIMMQLLLLAAFGMDGFAYAAEGLAGHALGAGDGAAFKAAVTRCWLWCAATGLAIASFFAIAHQALFGLLTGLPEVLALMLQYRWWLIALPIVAAPSYLLDGVFIGAAETRPMMTTMLVSTILIYLPAWWLARGWGNHGLWLAFLLFTAARSVTLYWVYIRMHKHDLWLRKQASDLPRPEQS